MTSAVCRRHRCECRVVKCEITNRQWRAKLCDKHWKDHCAYHRKKSVRRLAARNSYSSIQRSNAAKKWDIIEREVKQGRLSEPYMVSIARYTHLKIHTFLSFVHYFVFLSFFLCLFLCFFLSFFLLFFLSVFLYFFLYFFLYLFISFLLSFLLSFLVSFFLSFFLSSFLSDRKSVV